MMLQLPKNRPQIHTGLIGFNLKTNKNESFLIINETENIIFSRAMNLKFLITRDTI